MFWVKTPELLRGAWPELQHPNYCVPEAKGANLRAKAGSKNPAVVGKSVGKAGNVAKAAVKTGPPPPPVVRATAKEDGGRRRRLQAILRVREGI